MTEEIITDLSSREVINKIWGNSSSRLGFLTTYDDERHNVMTIEWMTHIQFTPPSFAISLVKGYHSIELLQKHGEFGLTFAATDQVELIKQLGSVSGDKIDKFEQFSVECREGTEIKPRIVINGVMAVECQVIDQLELSSSIVFVGQVKAVQFWDKMPVGYHQGNIYEYGTEIDL